MKFIRTKENSVFGVFKVYGIKLLTRLTLSFSHLNEHKFRYNFNNTINVSKEIIRRTFKFLKASECFVEPLYD